MQAALLPDRGAIKLSGEAARTFLNGLVTADIEKMTPGAARYAALLTPQGKVVADFIVVEAPDEDGGGFFLDCPRALTGALTERLEFYRLRAKVVIEDLSESLGVMAAWGGSGDTGCGLVYADPRLPGLGIRVLLPVGLAAEAASELGARLADTAAYEGHRIALGVPRGGIDFVYGDVFPHEADMDQLGGIDFAKGCYVGQEVVSRMEHRGTARTRVVPVTVDEHPPEAGMPVMAGDRRVGTTGSGSGTRGLALLRLDRAAEAAAAGTPLLAGGVRLTAGRPAWARWPESQSSE